MKLEPEGYLRVQVQHPFFGATARKGLAARSEWFRRTEVR